MLKDITRLSPCDMLVADTRGAVVLFCDGQILVRRFSLSGKTTRVTALEVQETGCKFEYFICFIMQNPLDELLRIKSVHFFYAQRL